MIENIIDKNLSFSKKLLKILCESGIDDEEITYRRKRLFDAAECKASSIYPVNDQFYQYAHEILSYQFCKKFGEVRLSMDHSHESGPDLVIDHRYQIECVCCNPGKSELKDYSIFNEKNEGILVDYNEREKIIFTRITSSVKNKKDEWYRKIKKGSIDPAEPYIIFVGLGSLAYEMFPGENGADLLGVFCGRDSKETITRDAETGEYLLTYHGFRPIIFIKKENKNVQIDANIFYDKGYRGCSAIIVSTAPIYEGYSYDDTWLFINPNADVPIDISDFSGMTYWNGKQHGDTIYWSCNKA